LGNILFSDVLDQKLVDTEDKFREILEQSLSQFLEKQIPVKMESPVSFEFKELKASLPGELIVVTMVATEGAPGKALFAVSKEAAGMLGDMLLLGDGSAAFSHEEHMEPVRDLFREVEASYTSQLGLELGRRIAFDDIKIALVDLTPADFVGMGWVMVRFEAALATLVHIYKMVSMDFYESCFPDSKGSTETHEAPAIEEPEEPEDHKEMGLVLDIELPISIELGRTSMLIRDIVKLAPGSIVELDKLSGEPVDLFVNGRIFARGEVVVVDENFAVRITELIAPHDNMSGRRN
jgi:flagellar motor switch protein FliN